MNGDREEIRRWLEQAVAKTGLTATALARRAGVHQTTVTRFLRDPDAPMMKTTTLNAIASAAGIPLLNADEPNDPIEAIQLTLAETDTPKNAALKALIAGRENISLWRLTTDALESAGYLPGDLLVVNGHAKPAPQHVVAAKIYQWDTRRADTVFRIYQPPYLIAATRNQELWKPHLIDNDRVMICGTVEASLRTTSN